MFLRGSAFAVVERRTSDIVSRMQTRGSLRSAGGGLALVLGLAALFAFLHRWQPNAPVSHAVHPALQPPRPSRPQQRDQSERQVAQIDDVLEANPPSVAEREETARLLDEWSARIARHRNLPSFVDERAFTAHAMLELGEHIEALTQAGNELELTVLRDETRATLCDRAVPWREKLYYFELARALAMPEEIACSSSQTVRPD
jgi:hypothetical protein